MMNKHIFLLFLVSFLFLFLVSSDTGRSEILPPLSLQCPSQVNESMTFLVAVTSRGVPVPNVTIAFHGQTSITNRTGLAYVYASRVLPRNNNMFLLIASKEGYNETIRFITILNVPQLFLSTVKSYIRENTSFRVIITDDEGTGVPNATILFNNTEYISNINGYVDLTTPYVKKKAEMFINAAKSGYLSNTIIIVVFPGVSQENLIGFLLVIGMCLCIAMLLLIFGIERYLKRRRINKLK